MRVTEKLTLIDKIGRELQGRYTFDEINAFITEFGIVIPDGSYTSKWTYAKDALRGVPTETLLKIAEELDLSPPSNARSLVLPRNWIGTQAFRLFISHISADRDKAMRLRTCLQRYGISGFVAHEDIHPTLEWQEEIERALCTMDAFIAIHTRGFSKSVWTQQEVGFALGRGIKVISFKMGEDPTGFIQRRQALARKQRSAEEIAMEIDKLLAADERTATRLSEAKRHLGLELDEEIPF